MNLEAYLTAENIRSVTQLELLARETAKGILPGLNASFRTGAGQEFSQYRNYQPGDDLRQLDWKLYARSDRFYVRQSEIETNLQIHFVLDASASMLHEDAGLSKLDYARYFLATLAWLANQQGDAISLYALNDQGVHHLPAKSGYRFFQRFLYELTKIEGGGRFPGEGKMVNQLQVTPRKEIVVFISDLYEHKEELTQNIQLLSRMHSEIIVFHLLARNELTLDYQGASSFEDLETGQIVRADQKAIQKEYQRNLEEKLAIIAQKMISYQATYEKVVMNEPVSETLYNFLTRRSKKL